MNLISSCKYRQPAPMVKGGYGLCSKTEAAKMQKIEKGICPYHGNMKSVTCLCFKQKGGKV